MTNNQASDTPSPTTATRFGLQGTVIGWQDPWGGEVSETVMRTGTGKIYPSQDAAPSREDFIGAMKELGADFYVHHLFPGLEGQRELLEDMSRHGIDLCLGNEYGNINGPWVPGTNRYDVPDSHVLEAAQSGRLIGLLYDEPEHLQINAGQYRKDSWQPHWGDCGSASLEEARRKLTDSVAQRVRHVEQLLAEAGLDPARVPLLAEHVFPVLFHAQARGGMALCPKIMKECFQPLQMAGALGAAKQYERDLWICADLWGPDVGEWPIRTPGFPGHSPKEYASALRMGYLMGPTHLFTENADALLRYDGQRFASTVFGDVWQQFVREYVPAHPRSWTHRDATPDIVLIHSDDSNYGQNKRLFGSRELAVPDSSRSSFAIWHLISRGALPAHGNNMHIPGYDFPRHELKRMVPEQRFPLAAGHVLEQPANMHPLFYPSGNVLVYDEHVDEQQLKGARLIFIAGSSVSAQTLRAALRAAEQGAVVLAASWLLPSELQAEQRFATGGRWQPIADFLSADARELAEPLLGPADCWLQRFGDTEVRMYPGDAAGFSLAFQIHTLNR